MTTKSIFASADTTKTKDENLWNRKNGKNSTVELARE